MPLAADYPLLEVLWTIAIIFLWFLWIMIVVWMLVDNFTRHDHSGWAKAGWTVFIIFLPVLGVLVYLVARPTDVPTMGAWPSRQSPATRTSATDELTRLAKLRDDGALTDEEFDAQKRKILAD